MALSSRVDANELVVLVRPLHSMRMRLRRLRNRLVRHVGHQSCHLRRRIQPGFLLVNSGVVALRGVLLVAAGLVVRMTPLLVAFRAAVRSEAFSCAKGEKTTKSKQRDSV